MSPARTPFRRFGAITASVLAIAAMGLSFTTSASAAVTPTTVNDPPTNNHSIIVFPDRDFIHGDGWAQGSTVTVEDIRGGVVVGTANATPKDDPATPQFDGLFDLNHAAGDPCWVGVTPDVRGNDVIRVTDQNGIAEQTPTANVKVTQVATMTTPASSATSADGVAVEKGTAVSATGGQFPAGQIQARLIANKQAFSNGRRDIRATPAYDSPTATTWTATYTGLTANDLTMIANSTTSRVLWLGRAPGAATSLGSPIESTIAESDGIAGPAAGCTAPLAKGPTTPALDPASDSGASNTDGITNVTTPTFTGGADAAGDTINLYVDGGATPVASGTSTAASTWSVAVPATAALTDGQHTVSAGEVNTATGVETRSVGSLTMTVDTATPAAPAVTGVTPASPGSSLTPSVKGTAETGSNVSLFSDAACTTAAGKGTAADFAGAGLPATVAANSTTTFNANATDVAGNVSPCSTTSVTYVNDGTPPPAPTIDSAPASPSNSNAPSFTFSDTEAGVTFACSMTTGADAFKPCTSPQAYTALADGSYTFKVQASDAAGNTSTASKPLVIDTAAPTTTITAPASPSKNNSPSFTFTSKPGSTFKCSMSTGADAFTACTSPQAYTALADGNYTFKVQATDPAGNVGPIASSALVVDTVAPAAQITLAPAKTTADNPLVFDFATADPADTFQCSLTLATATVDNYRACTSPASFARPADGNYTFKVKATDAAGNVGSPATYGFTVNTVPPTSAVGLSPTSLTFASTNTGTTSAAQAVTLSNTGNAALNITSIGITGLNATEFAETHPTCGATLAANSSCTINVTFKPAAGSAAGSRTATLSVSDSAPGSPHTVALSGTAAVTDTVAPTVTARAPGVNVFSVNAANNITTTFSEAVKNVTTSTFAIRPASAAATSTPIAGTVTQSTTNANQWILNPTANLANDTKYTVTLTGGAGGIADVAGNALAANVTWSFTTGPAPNITARTPAVNGTGFSRTANVTATLSENVTGVSGTTATLKNAATGAAITAVVSYNATTHVVTINPSATLAATTKYTVTLTNGIKDAAGNPLTATATQPLVWSFTTGTV